MRARNPGSQHADPRRPSLSPLAACDARVAPEVPSAVSLAAAASLWPHRGPCCPSEPGSCAVNRRSFQNVRGTAQLPAANLPTTRCAAGRHADFERPPHGGETTARLALLLSTPAGSGAVGWRGQDWAQRLSSLFLFSTCQQVSAFKCHVKIGIQAALLPSAFPVFPPQSPRRAIVSKCLPCRLICVQT